MTTSTGVDLSELLGALYMLGVVIAGLVVKKITEWVKTRGNNALHDPKSNTLPQVFFERLPAIGDRLGLLRDQLGADRVTLFLYHNGDRFTLDVPSWKMTNCVEKCRAPIRFVSKDWTGIQVMQVMDVLGSLLRGKSISGAHRLKCAVCPKKFDCSKRYLYLYSVELGDPTFFRQMLSSYDIKHVMVANLQVNGSQIGLLMADIAHSDEEVISKWKDDPSPFCDAVESVQFTLQNCNRRVMP